MGAPSNLGRTLLPPDSAAHLSMSQFFLDSFPKRSLRAFKYTLGVETSPRNCATSFDWLGAMPATFPKLSFTSVTHGTSARIFGLCRRGNQMGFHCLSTHPVVAKVLLMKKVLEQGLHGFEVWKIALLAKNPQQKNRATWEIPPPPPGFF